MTDDRVCCSCLALHGTEFPLDETLDDHPNGRCAMIPVTPSWSDLGFTIRTFWVDLKANWGIFILLGFVIQPAIVLWARTYFPAYLAHIQARLPFEQGIGSGLRRHFQRHLIELGRRHTGLGALL